MQSNDPVQLPEFCDSPINVLGYQEEGEWVALALELDLRGYGKTFEKALGDLRNYIEMQISFALHKNDPDMIFHPAESVYYQLFAQVRADHLRALVTSRACGELEYQVGGIPMPPAHVIDDMKKNEYALADG